MSAYQTARNRARAELTREIAATARRQLAEVGAAGLSLRAVARDLGMSPSAMYRYYRSRDEILTALITEAYNALGSAAEAADAQARARGLDPGRRWLDVCRAVRGWARANPHEFALIYGTPVPGYTAPADTIAPATRLTHTLAGILTDAAAAGTLQPPARPIPPPRLIHPAVLQAYGSPPAPFEDLIERALLVWTALIGTISFELSGQFANTVTDLTAYFDAVMTIAAETAGLQPT
jgi:AcrR family transcriptional regulator